MTNAEWKELTAQLSAIYAKVKKEHETSSDTRPVQMECWFGLCSSLCSAEFYMRELSK